jgi:D-glycero-D-manno-heptose 1,7-bisphosphate phosphatase
VIIYLKNISSNSLESLKQQFLSCLLDAQFVISENDDDKKITSELSGRNVLICDGISTLHFNPLNLLNEVKKYTNNVVYTVHISKNKGQKLLLINDDFSLSSEGKLSKEYLDGYEFSGISYQHAYRKKNNNDSSLYLPMGKNKTLQSFGHSRPALFLDRDGIINEDHGYVSKFEDIVWNEESIELIKFANQRKYLVFVLTNQSGISQGFYSEDDVKSLHHSMNNYLISKQAIICSWYYGPYSYKNAIKGYKYKSLTRKPGAGMMLQALSEFNIDLNNSIMVGDKLSDQLILSGPKYFHLKGKYNLDGASGKVISSLLEIKESML